VAALFADFEKAGSSKKRKEIVAEICTELTVHIQVEEEIFYPAFKAALKDRLLVPEGTVEHGSIKDLIAQVEGVEPDGELYEARVMVMGEYVSHHVKEEQNEMFPKARASSMDLLEIGDRMVARKAELLAARGPQSVALNRQTPTRA
jgi:iron-sulfur cluster repair protein YtfE (RIC family)